MAKFVCEHLFQQLIVSVHQNHANYVCTTYSSFWDSVITSSTSIFKAINNWARKCTCTVFCSNGRNLIMRPKNGKIRNHHLDFTSIWEWVSETNLFSWPKSYLSYAPWRHRIDTDICMVFIWIDTGFLFIPYKFVFQSHV